MSHRIHTTYCPCNIITNQDVSIGLSLAELQTTPASNPINNNSFNVINGDIINGQSSQTNFYRPHDIHHHVQSSNINNNIGHYSLAIPIHNGPHQFAVQPAQLYTQAQTATFNNNNFTPNYNRNFTGHFYNNNYSTPSIPFTYETVNNSQQQQQQQQQIAVPVNICSGFEYENGQLDQVFQQYDSQSGQYYYDSNNAVSFTTPNEFAVQLDNTELNLGHQQYGATIMQHQQAPAEIHYINCDEDENQNFAEPKSSLSTSFVPSPVPSLALSSNSLILQFESSNGGGSINLDLDNSETTMDSEIDIDSCDGYTTISSLGGNQNCCREDYAVTSKIPIKRRRMSRKREKEQALIRFVDQYKEKLSKLSRKLIGDNLRKRALSTSETTTSSLGSEIVSDCKDADTSNKDQNEARIHYSNDKTQNLYEEVIEVGSDDEEVIVVESDDEEESISKVIVDDNNCASTDSDRQDKGETRVSTDGKDIPSNVLDNNVDAREETEIETGTEDQNRFFEIDYVGNEDIHFNNRIEQTTYDDTNSRLLYEGVFDYVSEMMSLDNFDYGGFPTFEVLNERWLDGE